MAKKGSSKHQQEEYKRYQGEDRWKKNKIRRLTRYVKNNPNDKQTEEVLNKGKFTYSRNSFKNLKKEPKNKVLKTFPIDYRKGLKEQLQELIDSGELELTRN